VHLQQPLPAPWSHYSTHAPGAIVARALLLLLAFNNTAAARAYWGRSPGPASGLTRAAPLRAAQDCCAPGAAGPANLLRFLRVRAAPDRSRPMEPLWPLGAIVAPPACLATV